MKLILEGVIKAHPKGHFITLSCSCFVKRHTIQQAMPDPIYFKKKKKLSEHYI